MTMDSSSCPIEAVIEADLPIIDAHHHLWATPNGRYLFDDIVADVSAGHNICATVFIEAQYMWRQKGPEHLRCVGEVEFANAIAAMSASGIFGTIQICAAIAEHFNGCETPLFINLTSNWV
jgi:L-fuconolactonase